MKAIKMVWAVALLGACAVDLQDAAEDVATESAEQAATTSDVWHANWNGGSANASFWNETGGGYIDVFESKSGSARSAYLTLSAWSVDPTSQICETWDYWGYSWTWCYYSRSTYTYGWGQIPSGDALINPGTAHVRTTLPSTFGGYECTWDANDWMNSGCTPIAGGSVDVKWSKNGYYSTFSSGTNQTSYGTYTMKTQGTYRSTSAFASGSVLGIQFVGAYGNFGDTRGVNVTKSIVKTSNP